jgi:hypothetical protein
MVVTTIIPKENHERTTNYDILNDGRYRNEDKFMDAYVDYSNKR